MGTNRRRKTKDQPEEKDQKEPSAVEQWSDAPSKRRALGVHAGGALSGQAWRRVLSMRSQKVEEDWGADRFRSDCHGVAQGGGESIQDEGDVMSKNGIGYVAANAGNIKNYGEKRAVGHTEPGEGSTQIQRAGVKKASGSVQKMIMGGKHDSGLVNPPAGFHPLELIWRSSPPPENSKTTGVRASS